MAIKALWLCESFSTFTDIFCADKNTPNLIYLVMVRSPGIEPGLTFLGPLAYKTSALTDELTPHINYIFIIL